MDSNQRTQEFLQSILRAAPVGIGVVIDRCFIEVNPYLSAMTGYSAEELLGKSARILYPSEDDYAFVGKEKYAQIGRYGSGSVETRWRRKDGTIIEVLLSSTPLDRSDLSKGVTFTALDITEKNRAKKILEARLRLLQYANTHSVRELLVRTLDEIEALTDSKVAFYHFLDIDQKTVRLQAWSSRTSTPYCKAVGEGLHYPIDRAGVWVDCVHARRPVIHNDYASLPHKKGLPEGHVPVVREAVVPVIRYGRVTAILGVGNKEADYDENDAELVSQFADLAWDIAERKMMEEAMVRNERRLRQIAANLPGAIYQFRSDGEGQYEVPYISEGAEMIFERPLSELARPVFEDLHPEDAYAFKNSVEEALRDQKPWSREFRIVTPRGAVKWLRASSKPHRADDGGLVWDGVILDVTELNEAEKEQARLREQIMQAQKLESVGRLAGGVAHDFNNMLGVILGTAEIALSGCSRDDPVAVSLETIRRAALRSADLVRQLLAFARKQTYSPKMINVNETIEGLLKMLSRLIGENIRLEFNPGPGVPPVMMDPVQLDQILANLCVNSRDAIKDTGFITIETERILLKGPDNSLHLPPGSYAVISFSDSGCGMTGEVLERLFEPFFTTKEVGKGTGLGLATVYGIVKQNKGGINVESSPGRGTTFRIYIPGQEDAAAETKEKEETPRPRGGSETILLVEDEPMMLEMGRMMLVRLGYKVIAATTPQEALKAAQERNDIDLLITDVVMPDMNGVELAEHIRRRAPGIKCLFASGYPEDTVGSDGFLVPGVNLIEKPFTLEGLAGSIRKALNG